MLREEAHRDRWRAAAASRAGFDPAGERTDRMRVAAYGLPSASRGEWPVPALHADRCDPRAPRERNRQGDRRGRHFRIRLHDSTHPLLARCGMRAERSGAVRGGGGSGASAAASAPEDAACTRPGSAAAANGGAAYVARGRGDGQTIRGADRRAYRDGQAGAQRGYSARGDERAPARAPARVVHLVP
uniref:Uncharacterized protein n=1 Tax=uncultured marine virus TaxID=186617 RepID=A0A0F7L233_9VIRU|nr:hypothetical protein [uncultured marine virus]